MTIDLPFVSRTTLELSLSAIELLLSGTQCHVTADRLCVKFLGTFRRIFKTKHFGIEHPAPSLQFADISSDPFSSVDKIVLHILTVGLFLRPLLSELHKIRFEILYFTNQKCWYTSDAVLAVTEVCHRRQESSAKLTNQRVSYAFISSPFSFHARHILPASNFQYSYSCILLIFYRHQWTACMRTVSVNTVHWFDASSSGNPNE